MKDLLEVIEEGRETLKNLWKANLPRTEGWLGKGRVEAHFEGLELVIDHYLTSHTKAILTNQIERMKGDMRVHTKDCGFCNNCESHVSSCEMYFIIHGKNKALQTQIDYLEGVLKKI